MIRATDPASGLVNTEWREYTIPYGRGEMIVRDKAQATASAKGAQLQYVAECRLVTQKYFGPCRDLGSQALVRDALTAEYKRIYNTISGGEVEFDATPLTPADATAGGESGLADGGSSSGGCPTTAACGCSGYRKAECGGPCCRWVVGSGCGCR